MAYRVLIAQFMHETNTFSKLPTTLDDYRKRWLIEGEAMVPRFAGTKNEIGGYIDSAKKYGWQPGWAGAANATPSGQLPRECGETIRDMIVNAAKKAGKLDGVCLSLHGAMVTETEDDAEGALLELLRSVVGPDVPIATRADRDDTRPARQRHDTHGEERQCAGELSHLSAHRRLRARRAGGRPGAGGDGGQEEAALPPGAAGDVGGRRTRAHHPARPDARPFSQGRCVRERAGHQRGQHPGGIHR